MSVHGMIAAQSRQQARAIQTEASVDLTCNCEVDRVCARHKADQELYMLGCYEAEDGESRTPWQDWTEALVMDMERERKAQREDLNNLRNEKALEVDAMLHLLRAQAEPGREEQAMRIMRDIQRVLRPVLGAAFVLVATGVMLMPNCKCQGLGDAVMDNRARAAYAASWHYLSPAAQERDWEKDRKLRAIMVRELFGCIKHRHGRGA